jgi:hypothetical protein
MAYRSLANQYLSLKHPAILSSSMRLSLIHVNTEKHLCQGRLKIDGGFAVRRKETMK